MPASSVHSSVLFDATPRQRLSEVFAPCFTLIMQLRETDNLGDSDLLRSRILDLLKSSEQEAFQAAIPSSDIKDARFALVAFLDEAIISSNWESRSAWVAKPLQVQLYGKAVAGVEFFERLERLKADAALRHDVMEVYYLCLAMGFKGKYQVMGAAGQNEIRLQIEDTFARLQTHARKQDFQLAPHGRPRDQVATEVKSKLPPWVIAVAAASIGLVVYIAMSIMMNGSLNDTCSNLETFITTTCG
jgi:type VI secretion system protein ImpK